MNIQTNKETEFDFQIQYCGGWGSEGKAKRLEKYITDCYPKAVSTLVKDNGFTRNMILTVKGDVLFDKVKGDGQITDEKIEGLLHQIKKIVEWWHLFMFGTIMCLIL